MFPCCSLCHPFKLWFQIIDFSEIKTLAPARLHWIRRWYYPEKRNWNYIGRNRWYIDNVFIFSKPTSFYNKQCWDHNEFKLLITVFLTLLDLKLYFNIKSKYQTSKLKKYVGFTGMKSWITHRYTILSYLIFSGWMCSDYTMLQNHVSTQHW